ncbi:uncharacterized protein LOC122534004 [Frieseomelitta varia]|uniref:uncharacterized protein LOC122534004 n=1 Tax=Frieseomelitta varia TaxID=561572 RepID=UPI001CB689AF|nr:uncharacterized protein LOC122534004 [Frieseomelitta varia]
MLRGFALRCLEPVSPRATASPCASVLRGKIIIRRNYERFRRSGDGRKREWFEEKSAASQDEYFRKETARQLKELRRALKRKAEEEKEMECGKKRKRRTDDVACPPDSKDKKGKKRTK